MDQRKLDLGKYKEIADLVGVYARWGTLAIGGLCLLIYSNEIDQFPEGINLGEGLAFYLVSVGFLIAYTAFVFVVTALGSVMMAWPTILFQRVGQKRLSSYRTHLERHLKADYSLMWSGTFLILAALGLLFWALYALKHPLEGATFAIVPITQGVFVAFALSIQPRLRVLNVGLVAEGTNDAEHERKRNAHRLAQKLLIVSIVALPMLLAPNRTSLVDAGFAMAQLRKESATVHVKKPWADRVALSTLKSKKSFLGEDYVEFEKVRVLLRSVGSKVVVALPQSGDKPSGRLSIPTDAIVVE